MRQIIPSVCLEGHRHSLILLSLCVRGGDREPAQINIMCVYVREGETKCLHSLLLDLCVGRKVD